MGEDYLEGGIQHSFGIKPEILNKFKTPAPNAYDADKGEEYLEGTKAISMGVKLSELRSFSTPAPNVYHPEECKDDPTAITMHGKLKEPKKFQTPAPNKYEAIVPDEHPSFAFGVKHSPYTYQHNSEQFRPRQGTFTKEKTSKPSKVLPEVGPQPQLAA